MTVNLKNVIALKFVEDTREREANPKELIEKVEKMNKPRKEIREMGRQKGLFW